ncbi:hypothetical protein EYF80_034823 [Liparis tanakae]|uniref:Uncharacterized protein n=1 Tax=Liparis tanakae TaxID=230148 RepID=A0A4Z2GP78_9TELE|nr:hypothetical protein EYF80_034823 [Liparis tanakae]
MIKKPLEGKKTKKGSVVRPSESADEEEEKPLLADLPGGVGCEELEGERSKKKLLLSEKIDFSHTYQRRHTRYDSLECSSSKGSLIGKQQLPPAAAQGCSL